MAGAERNTAKLWSAWRRLYPLYMALAREFVIDAAPCGELDEELQTPSAEAFSQAENWFAGMDARIHIHHLRHFAQTSPLMMEEAIGDLLAHYLTKPHADEDRDKVDFLLVQMISMRVNPRAAASDLTLDMVAKELEPVIGPAQGEAPAFTRQLDEWIAEAEHARNLNALFTSRIIERSREIKANCGNEFFQPLAMAAFARFGLLIRRNFFRLMQADLNATLDGLRELEKAGVTTVDCRRAQFGADEPITRIRMICQSWRVMFQAEYSSGQPLCLLVDLRTAVEAALAHRPGTGGQAKAASGGPKTG